MYDMEDKDLISIYNSISQQEHNEFESMYELLTMQTDIDKKELKKVLSYFILKSYLLENKLI